MRDTGRPNSEGLTPIQARYVTEYLRDFEHRDAAIRAGVPRLAVRVTLEEWDEDPNVQRAIAARIDAAVEDEMLTGQRTIAMLMREANDPTSSGAARVAAIKELRAVIREIREREEKAKQRDESGVIEVPTMFTDGNDWERIAKAAQAQLKADVRK